jgi:hypothetical protein
VRVALILTLLLIGGLRVALLVAHTPVYGYANNYDFERLANWHGLRDVPGEPLQAHPEAPIRHYWIDAGAAGDHAYVSSELLFLEPAVRVQRLVRRVAGVETDLFDIRWMGGVRAFAFALGAAGLAWLFGRRRNTLGLSTAVWISAGFAFVIADPVTTLFFNTLYCEPSGVFFAFLAFGALWWLHTCPEWSLRWCRRVSRRAPAPPFGRRARDSSRRSWGARLPTP